MSVFLKHCKIMPHLSRNILGSEVDRVKYKEQCQTVKLLSSKNKTKFYSCKINQSRNDIKKLYDLSKKLLGMVKQPKLPESDSDQILAEFLSKFFTDKY